MGSLEGISALTRLILLPAATPPPADGHSQHQFLSDPIWGAPVARVVIDVMLKPEILDPQGKAVERAAARLGYADVRSVRQGKRFVVDIDGPADEQALAGIRELAESLLANTVIEDFSVRVEDN